MTPVEILTLVPLGTLVVIFGIQPGLLLNLVPSTVTETLGAVQPSRADRDPERASSSGPRWLLVLGHRRPASAGSLLRPRPRDRSTPEGGAAH